MDFNDIASYGNRDRDHNVISIKEDSMCHNDLEKKMEGGHAI